MGEELNFGKKIIKRTIERKGVGCTREFPPIESFPFTLVFIARNTVTAGRLLFVGSECGQAGQARPAQ